MTWTPWRTKEELINFAGSVIVAILCETGMGSRELTRHHVMRRIKSSPSREEAGGGPRSRGRRTGEARGRVGSPSGGIASQFIIIYSQIDSDK